MLAIALFIAGMIVPAAMAMLVWARANPFQLSHDSACRAVLFVAPVIGFCFMQASSAVAYSDARTQILSAASALSP